MDGSMIEAKKFAILGAVNHVCLADRRGSGLRASFTAPRISQDSAHLSGRLRASFRAPRIFQGSAHLSGLRASFTTPRICAYLDRG
ncbi:hypothetical protein FRC10_003810, partial [Ceratobasidium sp. 414]